MSLKRAMLLLVLAFAGCGEITPAWIYVPAPGYRCDVKIELPAKAKVGEVIVLKAERRSGPWKRVRKEDALEAFPWAKEPPAFESGFEVTANVRWEVSPSGAAHFDHVGLRARTVKFLTAGRYKVEAESATPTASTSNEVEIVIE